MFFNYEHISFCGNEKDKPPAMQVSSQIASISSNKKKNLQYYNDVSFFDCIKIGGGFYFISKSQDNSGLSHTTWNCKYHVVFAPKYRRQIIYGQIKADIGKILRDLCERKGIEIVEAECCSDHIHMLIKVPPKYSISEIMGYLKGKSSLIIFDRHANLKYKYGNRHFWCRGYYVDTVGKNAEKIKEYIRNQLQEDYTADQITLKEYYDPFTGEPTDKSK